MDDLKTIVGRIERRLLVVGMNPTSASREAGLSTSAIYNLQRGAKGKIAVKGGNVSTYTALAPVLRTTVSWLTEGKGPEDATDATHSEGKEKLRRIVEVPVLDSVAAGRLKSPMSQIPVEDVPLLAFADLGRGEWFALEVDGDSMNRISPEGSTIVVNRADRQLINGKCYVFSVRGQTTYKMWQAGPVPHLKPFSTNPIHDSIFPAKKRDLEVIGRVKRTLLDL